MSQVPGRQRPNRTVAADGSAGGGGDLQAKAAHDRDSRSAEVDLRPGTTPGPEHRGVNAARMSSSAKAAHDAAPAAETDLRPDAPLPAGLTRCTGPHCGRPIRWVVTLGDKRMPLDPDPHPDGNVIRVTTEWGEVRAQVLTGRDLPAQQTAWVPHHRTCPDAADYRRRQAATAPRCRAGCGYVLDQWLVENGWPWHVNCAPPTWFRDHVNALRERRSA